MQKVVVLLFLLYGCSRQEDPMLVHFKCVIIISTHDSEEEGGTIVRRVLVCDYQLQDADTHWLVLLRDVKQNKGCPHNQVDTVRDA